MITTQPPRCPSSDTRKFWDRNWARLESDVESLRHEDHRISNHGDLLPRGTVPHHAFHVVASLAHTVDPNEAGNNCLA